MPFEFQHDPKTFVEAFLSDLPPFPKSALGLRFEDEALGDTSRRILAMTEMDFDMEDFDTDINLVDQLFTAAQQVLTDKLGPPIPIVIDHKQYVFKEAPDPIKAVVELDMPQFSAWALPGGGWACLQVEMEDSGIPIYILLYPVAEG